MDTFHQWSPRVAALAAPRAGMDPAWELPAFDAADLRPGEPRTEFCVVVPVVDEGERFRAQLAAMGSAGLGLDIVVADGGSSDGSTADLDRLGARDLLVKRGPGRLSAQLRMGFAWALARGYRGVVAIDGNGKDGWEAIPLFADRLREGFGFVQGSRYAPGGAAENTPLDRHLAVRLLHAPLISLAAGVRYTDTTNGFRGYSAALLSDPEIAPFRDVFADYNLHYYLAVRAPRVGHRVCEVPVRRSYPPSGVTPTKIGGLGGRVRILRQLAACCLGAYDPPRGGGAR